MGKRNMSCYRTLVVILTLIGTFGLCGANCHNLYPSFLRPVDPRLKLPPKLSTQPTLSEVIAAVNANNSCIHSFYAARASLSVPNSPTLRANIAFQRPMRLRLKGEVMMSSVIDMGSNDEHFWFWAKPNTPPTVYFCRHDRYAGSSARQMLPIDPMFLIEAFGIGTIDPGGPHSGPYRRQDGRLEIRSVFDTAEGRVTKRTIIDPRQAWILEQHLFDSTGKLIVSSVTDDYRQDPLSGLWIAKQVKINSPSTQFSMQLNLGDVRINQLPGNPAELWTMPQISGAQIVDLGCPTGVDPSAVPPPAPPVMPPQREPIELGFRQLPAHSAVY